MNLNPVLEKPMIEETKTGAPMVSGAAKADTTTVIAPAPAPVPPTAPIVLSQAPPMVLTDAKPVVDKASTVVPSTFEAMK
jgi:hypothetical protein